MSLFPSEAEQIEQIAEAESVQQAPSAFSIPQEDIDLLLIFGSNDREGRMKIATEFMKHKRPERVVDFLKKTYRGAYGIETERGKFSSFAAEDGIHIARGDGAEYARDAQVLSWMDAATRIGQLLDDGRYALIECKLGSAEIEMGANHLLKLQHLIREHNRGESQVPIREPDLLMILTGGEYAYRRQDGVYVIPIGCLKD